MGYRTDYARVQGKGAAHEGAGHWWGQRITAIALVPLTPLFAIPFGRALGEGHEAMVATYSQFGHAFVAIAFVLVACWHLRLGMQVVIEDYAPAGAIRTSLLIGNTLLAWGLAGAGVLAVASILFAA